MTKRPDNNIISFDQPGEFYRKRAQRLMDKRDLWGALSCLRTAEEKSSDPVQLLDIAEILAQMGLYERSSEILLSLIAQKDDNIIECYFSCASNAYALGWFNLAHDLAMMSLHLGAKGDMALDLRDMLHVIRDELDHPEILEAPEMGADEGKRLLDEGDFPAAIEKLTDALSGKSDMVYAQNNLALSYYCMHENERAVLEGKRALEIKPDDVHALANMALFLHATGDESGAMNYIQKARSAPAGEDETGDQYKVCLTMAEMGMHEAVSQLAKEMLSYSPYDERVLYLYTLSQFNICEYAGAYKTVQKLRSIAPESPLYSFLEAESLRGMNGNKTYGVLSYTSALPMPYIIDRINELHTFMALSKEEAAIAFLSDNDLKLSMNWCLHMDDNNLKHELLSFIAKLSIPESELFLRTQLLSLDQSDELKKELVMLLSRSGAQPPYTAIIGDSLAEINVKETPLSNKNIPPSYEEVLKTASQDIAERFGEEAAFLAMQVWIKFILTQPDDLPQLRSMGGWIAALIQAVAVIIQAPLNTPELARQYHTRVSTILDRSKALEEAYEIMPI
ncbi:MAG: hypothetical protein IJB92_05795 [Clostridia bacterium]|nr:hypothetical protein [Clostridia bacterium]